LAVFFVPETYEPVILAHKAARKRRETGDKRYFAAIEKNDLPWMRRLKNILGKPFVVLMREPMLVAITVYMGVSYLGRMGGECARGTDATWQFVYGCVYLLFEAFPIVFEVGHHMNAGESGECPV
jgi:hypothetical protein